MNYLCNTNFQITFKQNVFNASLRKIVVKHTAKVFFDGGGVGRIKQKFVRFAAQVIVQGIAQGNKLLVNFHAHSGALADRRKLADEKARALGRLPRYDKGCQFLDTV